MGTLDAASWGSRQPQEPSLLVANFPGLDPYSPALTLEFGWRSSLSPVYSQGAQGRHFRPRLCHSSGCPRGGMSRERGSPFVCSLERSLWLGSQHSFQGPS